MARLMKSWLGILFTFELLCLAREAVASPPGLPADVAVYVADSDKDHVLCLVDRDGSGSIEAGDREAVPFYQDSSPGPDLSVPSALALGPGGEVYLLDGGTLDAVFVLADHDGDGRALGDGEWRVFYDKSSAGPNLSTPNALAFGTDGGLYVADDGQSAQRILRLEDTNGDGDALDEGEWKNAYDKTALSPAGGPLLDIEALAALPGGRLLAADSTQGRIYLLSDLNGDGDFLEADEVGVYFDPQGAFAFSSLKGLTAAPDGSVFAANSETGLVARLSDLDGNGDAMGPGEGGIFLDPASPPYLGDVGDLTVTSDGTLVILDRKANAAILAHDLDGDGRAGGEGEAIVWFDVSGLLSTPSGVAIGLAPPEPRVAIASIEPAVGPLSGGTPVRLLGRFESPETAAVTFAGIPAQIVASSSDAIDCIAPRGEREGPADVRVATAGGEAVVPGGYRYRSDLFIRADANGDGAVDISDAVACLVFLFLGGIVPACKDAMDIDDDGILIITDPIFLLNYLFLAGPSIPPPGPEPGFDETPDELDCQGAGV